MHIETKNIRPHDISSGAFDSSSFGRDWRWGKEMIVFFNFAKDASMSGKPAFASIENRSATGKRNLTR
ncbi:MAG: hypothetical protein K8F91_18790 [Candidatus Obscuribacterales bacterium]|nr:hypothetical protein [Candidatus Obscuribacterales bacterium]